MSLMAKQSCRKDKAISPAISTVIITGAMMALIAVALAFASNFLVYRIAESEFNSAQQFMQTIGLQIDDVAWVIGRTETARHSSRYGDIAFENALNYTIYINTTTQVNQVLYTNTTGIICYNMPVSRYSIGNNFFKLIYPSSNNSFLLSGASAPTARIFVVEKLPVKNSSFIRVVIVPTIRMLNLSIGDTDYIRLYLPILLEGESPERYESVTLTGKSLSKIGDSVTGIRIEVSFPMDELGFNNSFFRFPQIVESITLANKTVELYVGGVDVALGVHA
ncbi:MAG: hypothetical protein JSV51_00375 [Candidatus Bathyarchaeota archaeon]|nr:MAG: hypothetical protein JSV51_00375 [Candidatus Bathyarchaeota archaeon]